MLEITGADIAALNDDDLRSLVGRLCESELHSHGLPTSAVTWGGNQNARDGGIDVRVKLEDRAAPGGFIPRTSVGFQVKKTDFKPSLIAPEMRPYLRPKNAVEQVRTIVLTQAWGPLDYAAIDSSEDTTGEKIMAAQAKASVTAEELGKTIGGDQAAFIELLPELVTAKGSGRLSSFGKGLALVATDPARTWEQLTQAIGEVDEQKRNLGTLVGFLIGLSSVNAPLCETLLEKALTDETL